MADDLIVTDAVLEDKEVLRRLLSDIIERLDNKTYEEGIELIRTQLTTVTTQITETPTSPVPQLLNLEASSTFKGIFLTWDSPQDLNTNIDYVEIFRHTTDDRAAAITAGAHATTKDRNLFFEEVTVNTDYYYWVRAVSYQGEKGLFNAEAGTLGNTGLVGNVNLAELIIAAENLAENAVTSTKILDEAITNAKIAIDAIDTDNIVDGAVEAINLALNSVTSEKIVNAAITNAKLAIDAVDTDNIVDGAVDAINLALNSVTSEKIVDDAITNAKLAIDSVDTAQIVDGAVAAINLALNSVTSEKIVDDAITNAKLAINSVDTAQIVDDAIEAAQLANGVVGTTHIATASQSALLNSLQAWGDISDTSAVSFAAELNTIHGVDDNADVTDYEDNRVSNNRTENNVTTISRPVGASYNATSANNVGAIVITLPQSWVSTMLKMSIDVFQYKSDASFTLHCGGYLQSSTSTWQREFARLVGSTAANNRVRFGHDGTNCVIVIGETTSDWDYPKVTVRDFQAGHTNYTIDQWDDGWSISIVSSLTGYTFTGDFADALLDAKSILDQGVMATTDGQITTTNISSLIQTAAIGGAYIGSAAIGTAHIQSAAITTALIANLAVDAAKIANATITSAKIANLAITTALIDTAAITDTKIASAAVTTAKIANLAVDNSKIAALAVDAAKIANATITSAKIANLAITTALIDTAAITDTKIASAAVTTAKIDNLAVDNSKIAALAVDAAKIANATITSAKIANLAITTALIDTAAITDTKIASAAVTTAKIDNLAVDNSKIAALAVTDAKIANATITSAKIANLAITTALIDNAAVTAAKIGALAVGNAAIANGAITNAKIADLAVDTAKIADAAISSAKIGSLAVTNASIAHLAVGTINIQLDAVTELVTYSAAGPTSITANTDTSVGSMYFDHNDTNCMIYWEIELDHTNSTPGTPHQDVTVTLRQSGTSSPDIRKTIECEAMYGKKATYSFFHTVDISTSHTWYLYVNTSSSNVRVHQRFGYMLERKK